MVIISSDKNPFSDTNKYFRSTKNESIQNIPINLDLKKNDNLFIGIMGRSINNREIRHNSINFCLVFTK